MFKSNIRLFFIRFLRTLFFLQKRQRFSVLQRITTWPVPQANTKKGD